MPDSERDAGVAASRTAKIDVDVDVDWIALYRDIEKPLYNVVYRWLWDAAESEDVVHDAFLRCWQRRAAGIRADSVKGLVYRTALNLASNRRRSKRLWRWVSLDALVDDGGGGNDNGDNPDRDAAEDGATIAAAMLSPPLRAAVDSLPEPLKRVLLLSEIADMSYREIAEIVGIKEGTVGSRRARALAILRQRLGAKDAE